MSMLHLLMLLSNNPVGPDGFIDDHQSNAVLSNKKYLTKTEAEEEMREHMEQKVSELLYADKSDISDDDKVSNEQYDSMEDEESDQVDEDLNMNTLTKGPSLQMKQMVSAHKQIAHSTSRKQDSNQSVVRNSQMFFGGLPMVNKKATMVVNQYELMRKQSQLNN